MKNLVFYAIVIVGAVAYNAVTTADRDNSGAIVESGSLGAFDVRVGDCFDDAPADSTTGNGQVTSIPGVPCSEPHDNEIFAVFDVEMDEFPGDDEINQQVYDLCMQRFESFVGQNYESSSLEITMMYPSRESWARTNDREAVCAVYDMSLAKLEGSAKGRGL